MGYNIHLFVCIARWMFMTFCCYHSYSINYMTLNMFFKDYFQCAIFFITCLLTRWTIVCKFTTSLLLRTLIDWRQCLIVHTLAHYRLLRNLMIFWYRLFIDIRTFVNHVFCSCLIHFL